MTTKHVLCVTSAYQPVTAADMHRVRQLAWELPKLGWAVEVLAPEVELRQQENVESGTEQLFNPATIQHRVIPQDNWLFRILNMRTVGWRGLKPMAQAGAAVLRKKNFDLIYISTASFNFFCLGYWWHKEFKVPYVLDYHDPWVREKVDYRTTASWVKRWITAKLAIYLERLALKDAAGVVAVSPFYIEELRRRYGLLPCLREERAVVIPFAGSAADFRSMTKTIAAPAQTVEIAYVGAGGRIMAKSFTAFCAALAALRRHAPALVEAVKIRLYGTQTDWRAGEPKILQELADRFDLAGIIEEQPTRIPYLEAVERVQQSNALLVLGVDDKAYMPSKLFTYALSGKPLLGCFYAGSPPAVLLGKQPEVGHLITFDGAESSLRSESVSALRAFLHEAIAGQQFDRTQALAEYLAPGMAAKHVALFERICAFETVPVVGRTPRESFSGHQLPHPVEEKRVS